MIGDRKCTLTTCLIPKVVKIIEERSTGARKGKTQYASAVIEKWFADGCPLADAVEAAIIRLSQTKELVA